MEKHPSLRVIARIRNDFNEKFGIPRQSGLVPALKAAIVFEPEYRSTDALRGLDGFSHIWLLWQFSETLRDGWSPTVRPPRLGGNARMGVFATRSPFRPNAIGLSAVKLEEIREDAALGAVLIVSGADLMDGTPILDIKPYLPYADCIPDAVGGFAAAPDAAMLEVLLPQSLAEKLPADKRAALIGVLAQDPRPRYQKDPERVYGFKFAGFEIRFTVQDQLLTVCGIEPAAASDCGKDA